MTELTPEEKELLGVLIDWYPAACTYDPDTEPLVYDVAQPLIEHGAVDRHEITENGERIVGYRLSAAMVAQFVRTAAEKAAGAGVN